MATITWKLNAPNGTLCAHGYPIRIRKGGPYKYNLEVDGRKVAWPYETLASAKSEAELIASELDEFES